MASRTVFYMAILARIAHQACTGLEIAESLGMRRAPIDAVLFRMRGRVVHVEAYEKPHKGFPAARWRLGHAPDAPAPASLARARRARTPAHGWVELAAFIVVIESLLEEEPQSVAELVAASGCGDKPVRAALRLGREKNFMRICAWDRPNDRRPWVAYWSIGTGEDKPRPVADRRAIKAVNRRERRARQRQAQTPFVPLLPREPRKQQVRA